MMGKVQRAVQKLLQVRCNARAEKKDDEREMQVWSNMPTGFLAVYVGEERRRFVIDAKILKHETFRVLLEKSAEEFRYKRDGRLIILCDVAFFQHLLQLIETNSPSLYRTWIYWAFVLDNMTYNLVE